MKKLTSLLLILLVVYAMGGVVFAEDSISISQLLDCNDVNVTSIKMYIHGKTYEVDKNEFLEIAENCTVTPSDNPQIISNDGLYIMGGSSIFVNENGEIDIAVPGSGRSLYSNYKIDDVSFIEKLFALIPQIRLSKIIEFDEDELKQIRLYSPQTGTAAECSLETLGSIMLTHNSHPYEIDKNGLYITIISKSGNEGYIYLTRSGEVDYYHISDTSTPQSTYITKDTDKINKLFEFVRPRTHASMVEIVSDWAKEYISTARDSEIIPNTSDNFTVFITREEFCEIVFNTAIAINGHLTTDDAMLESHFTDTDDYKIFALNKLGIIHGKSQTEFAPDDFLTREEAATIVVRMINTITPMATTEMWFEYDDVDKISDWASDAVQTISNLGLMNGVGDNRFAPKDTYTKEQAITTLVRVYNATQKTYTSEDE